MDLNVGSKFVYRGQSYEVVDAVPHVCRDGREVILVVVKTRCAECARPFSFRTVPDSAWLNRRCHNHRAPGQRVRAGVRPLAPGPDS